MVSEWNPVARARLNHEKQNLYQIHPSFLSFTL